MTETTARIRWEGDSDGGFVGTLGTAKALAFTIWPPDEDGKWLLVVFFTGLGGGCVTCQEPAASPDELKRAAETWLAGFISSLGAVFPEQYAVHSENEGGTAVQVQPQCPPVPPHPEEETGKP